MENSRKLLVKEIEKFTEKSQLADYYTILTNKYCIKWLDAQICKIFAHKKNRWPKELWNFIYLFERTQYEIAEETLAIN